MKVMNSRQIPQEVTRQMPTGTQPQGTIRECIEPLRDSIEMPMSTKNIGVPLLQKECRRGFHSKPVEHLLHSPRTVSIGKSGVQAADVNHVNPQQVPFDRSQNLLSRVPDVSHIQRICNGSTNSYNKQHK